MVKSLSQVHSTPTKTAKPYTNIHYRIKQKKKKLKKLHCGYEKQRGSSRTWNIAAQFAFHAASARRAPSPLTPDMVNHIQIPHL